MYNFYFIGVDVSKKKLDFCVMFEGKVLREEQVANHQGAVAGLIGELKKDLEMDNEQFLICAEHTGQYTFPLACACKSVECRLWLENPSQIKYSSGMQRGKNDRVDAKRIAIYAARFGDKVRYYDRPTEQIERLKQLERERELYTGHLATYKAQIKDQKDYMPEDIYRKKAKRLDGLMGELQAALDAIAAEMDAVIGSTEVLSRQMELLMSIDGVGRVVALNMIIETEAFTRFDDPRKFCCHAGVAPFAYTSGSSQHSKNKVSHRANKNIKRLLHMAAVSVIHRTGGELKAYYLRKVEEGKNKMLVINALRAKIVARMFAVIKRNEFYSPIYI
jgi:transposase